MPSPRIAIVGGSMGGLSLAWRLGEHGIAARVYERSTGLLAHQGAGLMLAGAMVETLGPGGTRPVTRRVCLGAAGGVLREQRVEKHAVGWGDVYAALRRRTRTVELYEDCPVRSVEIGPPRVRTDRRGEEVFDLVVGADGIGSVVRERLDPHFVPRNLGYVAVRGLVPRAALPAGLPAVVQDLFDDAMAKVLLDGEHVTLYALPGADEHLNWMWYANVPPASLGRLLTDRQGHTHRWSMPAGAIDPVVEADLRALATERLPPWLGALVGATETVFLQPVFSGFAARVVAPGLALVGDAAHLAVPHVGGGVTLAVQDSLALADAIAAGGDALDTRLRRWADARLAVTRPRLEFAIRLGRSLQSGGKPWERWSRTEFERWWAALLADAPADASR
jgi:2,6-dihydroxypyridine 3-monooxygenase